MDANFSNYKPELNDIINNCGKMVLSGYDEFSLEIFLLFALKTKYVQNLVLKIDDSIDINKINNKLTDYIETKQKSSKNQEDSLIISDDVKEIIFATTARINRNSAIYIDSIDIIISILEYEKVDGESFARTVLNESGITLKNLATMLVTEEISDHNNKISSISDEQMNESIAGLLTNLNEKAKKDSFEIIGRDKEIAKAMQILNRKLKNNMVFTGDAGVGKTSVVNGIVQKINEGNVPPNLQGKIVYEVDIPKLVAGTKYRGDFEERMKNIIEFAKKNKNVILFFDEIQTLVSSGSSSSSSLDAANILKPALSNGDIKCIGVTTYDEYKKTIAKDPSLKRRFQEVKVKEPTGEESFMIIKGIIESFEKHHNVKYTDDAIKTSIDLSTTYIKDRFLPDKALDLIDEAGSLQGSLVDNNGKVGKKNIQELISNNFNVPIEKIQAKSGKILKDLERNLKSKIFGQDEAIMGLYQKVLVSYAHLNAEDKTEGSFLFLGPTGVGKTEIVNQLSLELNRNLIRIDMSEYMEKHSTSKLIGAAPGYVGYEDGGILTDQVQRYPDSIILIDEIEKAHPDVQNIFLQILDNATLTDSKGDSYDFTQTMVIFTSNAGAEAMLKRGIGFGAKEVNVSNSVADVEKLFKPELRNRIDHIITFNPLEKSNIKLVVDKFMEPIINKVKSNYNVNLSMTPSAKNWLVENGYDKKMGARPMARLINKEVTTCLASLLVESNSIKNKSIKISLKNNKLSFNFK